jgi:hypothetical protein
MITHTDCPPEDCRPLWHWRACMAGAALSLMWTAALPVYIVLLPVAPPVGLWQVTACFIAAWSLVMVVCLARDLFRHASCASRSKEVVSCAMLLVLQYVLQVMTVTPSRATPLFLAPAVAAHTTAAVTLVALGVAGVVSVAAAVTMWAVDVWDGVVVATAVCLDVPVQRVRLWLGLTLQAPVPVYVACVGTWPAAVAAGVWLYMAFVHTFSPSPLKSLATDLWMAVALLLVVCTPLRTRSVLALYGNAMFYGPRVVLPMWRHRASVVVRARQVAGDAYKALVRDPWVNALNLSTVDARNKT